jgi:hypothetical protein
MYPYVVLAAWAKDAPKDTSSPTTVLFGGTITTTVEGRAAQCALGRSARPRRGRRVGRLKSGRGSIA